MPVAIQVPRADYSTTSALAHKLAIHHLLQSISSLPQSLSLAFRLPHLCSCSAGPVKWFEHAICRVLKAMTRPVQ